MTMLELMVSVVVLLIAAGAIGTTLAQARRLNQQNRELSAASLAVQDVLEQMHALPFDEVFARFNASDEDDPGGALPSPGNTFVVPALVPSEATPDGSCGEIQFGTIGDELREDVVDPELSLPRDLDLDGDVDGADHAGDYRVLPLRIRVRWTGVSGNQEFELVHVLSELSG